MRVRRGWVVNDAILGVAPLGHQVANDIIRVLELAGCEYVSFSGALLERDNIVVRATYGPQLAVITIDWSGRVMTRVYDWWELVEHPLLVSTKTECQVYEQLLVPGFYSRRVFAKSIDRLQGIDVDDEDAPTQLNSLDDLPRMRSEAHHG